MAEAEPSLNIPSLLTLAVVSFLVIRWFLSSRTSGDNGGSQQQQAAQQRGRRVDPAQVQQISQMFPQLSRRDIMWDLHRNGGSVAATTERILTGRGLESPPPSYQPQIPTPATTQIYRSASTATSKQQAENLITRYKLEAKVAADAAANTNSTDESGDMDRKNGWSQNRTERQRLLQQRRDEMILAARRRMLEKDKSGGS